MDKEIRFEQFTSDEWISKIESCDKVDGLLDIWETEAKKRGERFLRDGSLSNDLLESHDILFVCRESNDSKCEDSNNFWMKRVVQGNGSGKKYIGTCPKETKAATKYYNCMKALIVSMEKVSEDRATEILERSAYININKSGGGDQADFQKLVEYALMYRPFIQKEIKLLKPEKIIILGKLYKKPLIELFEQIGQETQIEIFQYNRHPCVWSKKETKRFSCDIKREGRSLK